MKKLFITAISLVVLLNGFAQNLIIHDPNAQVRTVENFSAVSVTGDIDLYLSQGNEDAVAVSTSETSHRDRIRTQVVNNELKIWYDGKGLDFSSGNKKLKAYVSFKNITRLSASGASDVFVNGTINGNDLVIHLTGASDFKGAVEVDKLSLNQTGASDMTISGKASTLNIEATGASSVKGYNLEVENCAIRATGASDIKITVQKELTAKATGASSILYKGNGVIREVHTTGASSVNKKS